MSSSPIYEKSSLEKLLEALEFQPSDEQRTEMKQVVMPEHHAWIARAAMDALEELRLVLAWRRHQPTFGTTATVGTVATIATAAVAGATGYTIIPMTSEQVWASEHGVLPLTACPHGVLKGLCIQCGKEVNP